MDNVQKASNSEWMEKVQNLLMWKQVVHLFTIVRYVVSDMINMDVKDSKQSRQPM
jgi:hypothetical protein